MADKFRSLKAFSNFEQSKLGQRSEEPVGEVSPLRVLSRLKQHPQGIARVELTRELGVSADAVEVALFKLVREGLARVEERAGTEVLLAS